MSLASLAYGPAIRVLRAASPLLSRGSGKLARGIRGRVGSAAVLGAWARAHRDPNRPLVWVHAPSVGEGHQGRAVLEAVREREPNLQSVFTYFSPSAEAFGRRVPADVSGYLPWDVRREMEALLGEVAPSLLVFTKTEVWPGLAGAAAAKDVPTALVAATLPESSSRLRPLARSLLRPAFSALDRVLAISEEDGERFTRLGVAAERIHVTGDPAIDSAWRRAREADPTASFLAPFHADPRPTLVAGSTWPADEAVLVAAIGRLRGRFPDLLLVLAPHEPHDGELRSLAAALEGQGLRVRRLAQVEGAGTVEGIDAVIVDRVGVLAHLYTVGTLAYVGGGFGGAGIHSVLEPAAARLPVLFGPRHSNSRAAEELARGGGGRVVDGAESLTVALERLLSDAAARETMAAAAFGFVEAHRGASERTAAALEELLAVH